MSQNQPNLNQKRPAPAQNNKQAQGQSRPAPSKQPQRPPQGNKKPAQAPSKAPKTQAFNAVNKHNAHKSPKSRKRLVIAICAVIVLILATLLVLIIGNIMNKIKNPSTPADPNATYVEKTADDINIGNLLLINKDTQFDYAVNGLLTNSYDSLPNGIINLWTFKNNSANNAETKINIPGTDINAPTYELANRELANQICLEETTLHAFNKMMLDYCKTIDLSTYTEGSASKINVAWGWSHESDLLNNDIPTYGNAFFNHANGKTITLMKVKTGQEQDRITESILKNDFEWIYNHAHEYGFINLYPNACEEHTGFNSNGRLHLRYVGVEHATYIFENGICLDEYIGLLSANHGYSNPISITANGKEYQVYYVKCDHQSVQVPVPNGSTYTISGDNMNGFIVSVEK